MEKTADQFSDESLKLNFLQENGMLPANWQSITKKDAILFAKEQFSHKRKMFIYGLSFAIIVLLISAISFLVSLPSCKVDISNTGAQSTTIGINGKCGS